MPANAHGNNLELVRDIKEPKNWVRMQLAKAGTSEALGQEGRGSILLVAPPGSE